MAAASVLDLSIAADLRYARLPELGYIVGQAQPVDVSAVKALFWQTPRLQCGPGSTVCAV